MLRLNNSTEALKAKQVLNSQGFNMNNITKEFNELVFSRDSSRQRAKRLLKAGGFKIFN